MQSGNESAHGESSYADDLSPVSIMWLDAVSVTLGSSLLLYLTKFSPRIRILTAAIFLFPPAVPYGLVLLGWQLICKFVPGPSRYPLVDDFLWGWYQRFILFLFETTMDTEVTFYGDYKEFLLRRENVLYISNHQSPVDWIIADMVAVRQGSVGSIRYMLKDDLIWVPLYGWGFNHHGCVYVRRDGAFRPDIADRQLRYLASLQGYPFWIIIYPEGTLFKHSHERFDELVSKGRKIAKEKGLAPLVHHYMPRARGTQMIMARLGPRLDAIYDVTVIYASTRQPITNVRLDAPTLVGWLSMSAPPSIHVHIRRIPAAQLPDISNSDNVTTWLHARFSEKEKYFENFLTSGKIFDSNGVKIPLAWWQTFIPSLTFMLVSWVFLLVPFLRPFYIISGLVLLVGGYIYIWWFELA